MTTTPTRLLRLREVMHVTGLGRNAVYELAKTSGFPRPLKLTKRASAWREDEIQAWIDALPVSDRPSPRTRGNAHADKRIPD
jgi:prophage regulatory protein